MRGGPILAVLGLLAALSPAARASMIRGSLLPLDAERADTISAGMAEVAFGLQYSKDDRFPYFTEPGALRSQTRLDAPQLGFRIGAGDWAEIQAAYQMIYLHEESAWDQTNNQYGSGDATLHTKVRVLHENAWPGLAVRFGVKLPNASRDSGLGTDDTDFDLSFITSKDFGPLAAHVNLGIVLLGNSGPFYGTSFHGGGQDDLFSYDVAVESAPMGGVDHDSWQARVVAEVSGLTGTHYGNERSHGLLGLRLERGQGALYLGTSAGFVTASENFGLRAGILYSFEPSKWFED